MTDDPFDEGVPRDGYGRPLIIPAPRGKPNLKAKLVPYTRASTFASALDDGKGLTNWKVRHAVIGVAISPDLAAMVGALGRNLNTYSPKDKAELDAIVETAHDRSGGNDKANYGTAVHSLTEPGRDPFAVDERMPRDAAAYRALIDYLDVEVVDTETFVVNDDLLVAGTFDHTYRLRSDLTIDDELTLPAGTVLVGDKKTGTLHLGQHGIQLATYAHARKYDHVTGERSEHGASTAWGLAIHIPRGEGKAVAYLVDLAAGWKGAKLAAEVRAYRSGERKLGRVIADMTATPDTAVRLNAKVSHEVPAAAVVPAPIVEPLGEDGFPAEPTVGDAINNLADAGLLHPDQPDAVMYAIETAATADELHAVWRANKAAWTDAYTEAAKKRAGQIRKGAA